MTIPVLSNLENTGKYYVNCSLTCWTYRQLTSYFVKYVNKPGYIHFKVNTLFTYLVIFVAENVNCMAAINVKLVDKSDKATLYTICFEGEDISEFEKFLMKFKDNAELRRDYQIILLAVKKI